MQESLSVVDAHVTLLWHENVARSQHLQRVHISHPHHNGHVQVPVACTTAVQNCVSWRVSLKCHCGSVSHGHKRSRVLTARSVVDCKSCLARALHGLTKNVRHIARMIEQRILLGGTTAFFIVSTPTRTLAQDKSYVEYGIGIVTAF